MDEDQSFYVTIPTALFDGGDLVKACLYGIITSYAKKSGKCWASNKTLASKLGRISEDKISKKITELVREGYLTRLISKEDGNVRVLAIPLTLQDKTSYPIGYTSNISSNKYIYNKPKRKIAIEEITLADKETIAKKFRITVAQVESKIIAIEAWNKYVDGKVKDVLATLRNWIQMGIDRGEIKQIPIPRSKVQREADQFGVLQDFDGLWYAPKGDKPFKTEEEALAFKA